MKRFVALLMALGRAVTAAGCGSGQSVGSSQSALPSAPEASASVDAAQSASDAEAGASLDQQSDTVTMIYYLDLKDGSIMAACRDQSGIDSLGGDYIKVYTDNAAMEDAAGNPVALSDIARGSILQVTFPGMVTMSIPAQISASKIVVSAEAPADVPAENEIPDRGSGKWWEPEVVNQVPDLSIQYRSQYGQISQLIPYHTGSWSYGDDGAQQGGSIGIVDLFPNGFLHRYLLFSGETGKEGSMFAGARSRLCIQRGCLLLVYRPQKQNATETRRILGG